MNAICFCRNLLNSLSNFSSFTYMQWWWEGCFLCICSIKEMRLERWNQITMNVFKNRMKAFIVLVQWDTIGLQVGVSAVRVWGRSLLQHTWFYQFTHPPSLFSCLWQRLLLQRKKRNLKIKQACKKKSFSLDFYKLSIYALRDET